MSNIFNHLIFGGVGLGRVGGGLVLGVLGVAVVLDVSDVSVTVVLVGNGLDAAVGEEDAVRAGDNLGVAALLVAHVDVGNVVLDVISKAVRPASL